MNKCEHIFMLDDDKDDLDFFQEAFTILNTASKLFAYSTFKEFEIHAKSIGLPAIALIDLNMPVFDGVSVVRTLRQELKFHDWVFYIYSTSSSERDVQRALNAGANGYIVKPGSMKSIVALADALCKGENPPGIISAGNQSHYFSRKH